MIYRLGTINDYKDITSIWNKNTDTLFRYFKCELEKELNNNQYIVCCENDKVIGFGGYKYMPRKNCFKVIHLCISKEYRNNGIGKILLNKIMELAHNNHCVILDCDFIAECVSGKDNNFFWEKRGDILYIKHLKSMDIKVVRLYENNNI